MPFMSSLRSSDCFARVPPIRLLQSRTLTLGATLSRLFRDSPEIKLAGTTVKQLQRDTLLVLRYDGPFATLLP